MFSEFQQKPLHLVQVSEQGRLTINDDTLNYIKSIKSPVGILTIAGPYRTGKSFLLNSLISRQGAFQVGDTVRSKTKGLWVWGKPILASDTNSRVTNVLVMDSQGFGSVQETHDKRITTLALLMSTCFLYNSRGTIDKDAIFDLQYVIDIARSICVSQNVIHKTDFHWILRDFHLELSNELGQQITPNQYLQNSLYQCQEHVSKSTIQTLKSYFPTRNCHCLVKPNLSEDQRPQFTEKVIELRKIFKEMRSVDIDGKTIAQILKTYVAAINNGETLPRVFQEGYQCRVRLTCLQKLQSQLKLIEETSTSGDQMDQKIRQLRKQLSTYSKERMCSQLQLNTLQEDISQIITEFSQHNKPRQMTSIKVLEKKQRFEVTANKSLFNQSKSKLSSRLKQLEQQVNFTKSMKDSQLKFEKSINSKFKEQYEAKLTRLELQNSEIKKQLEYYKIENQKISKKHKIVEDQLQRLHQQVHSKQKLLKQTISRLNEQLQSFKNNALIANSQIVKIKSLSQEKIKFLQKCIKQNDETRKKIQKSIEQKYKIKIQDLLNQIQILNSKHVEQLLKIKQIYKVQSQQLIKGNSSNNINDSKLQQNYTEEIKKHLKINDDLTRQKQRLQYVNNELQRDLRSLNEKNNSLQQISNQKNQQITKKYKQKERRQDELFEQKMQSKKMLVQELENKIKQQNKIIHQMNQQHMKKLEFTNKDFDHQRQKHEEALAQANQKMFTIIAQFQTKVKEIQIKDDIIRQLRQKIRNLLENIENCKNDHTKIEEEKKQQLLNSTFQKKQLQSEYRTLKQRLSFLEFELQEQKRAKQKVIESVKGVHEIQKGHYQSKINSLQALVQQLKPLQTKCQQYEYKLQECKASLQSASQNSNWTIQKLQNRILQLNQALVESQKQKQKLVRDAQNMKNDIQTRYEQMQKYFKDSIQGEHRKYSDLATKHKNLEKQCIKTKQQNNQLHEQLRKAQNQNNSMLNIIKNEIQGQKKNLKKQIQKLKTENVDLLNQGRQAKNQLALLKQKNQFMASTIMRKQIEVNSSLQTEKQNYSGKIEKIEAKLRQKAQENQKIKNILNIYQQDQLTMISNMNALDKNRKDQQIKYNNHLRLYYGQLKQLKQSICLCQQQTEKWKKKYQQMLALKNSISQNYNKDFHLWVSKFNILQLTKQGQSFVQKIDI